MGLSLVLIHLGLVMAAAALRYGGRHARFVTPTGGDHGMWPVLIGAGLVAAGLLLARADLRQRRRRVSTVAWAETLLVFASLLGLAWAVLPSKPRDLGWLDWTALAGWLAMTLAIFARHRLDVHDLRRRLLRRPKWPGPLAVWTLLLCVVTIAGGLGLAMMIHGPIRVRWDKLAVSLATYPLYALAQMGLFLVFLVPRLRRMGLEPVERVGMAACLFALLHWPNGPLMVATLVGGAVWAGFYVLKRTHLVWLAISMGLLASCFARFVPHTFGQNMRVGPLYVERALEWDTHGPGPP
ncbi:MAG: type II CAAX prenyl endopeptidase Rce1 family protein [Phycisphaerae bacterium]